MSSLASSIRKRRIAARFDRTVEAYESGADAQKAIMKRAAESMRDGIGVNELWCDFGSGSAMMLDHLRELPRGTRFICLDLAFAALRRAVTAARADMAINGDVDFLPIRWSVFDGASAISSLQWAESPENALRGIASTLKPSGQFYFSIFANGSFGELAELRALMGLPPVVWLPEVDELLTVLDDSGFEISKGDIEDFHLTQRFPSARSALESMSGTGVTATGGRLLNRGELDELRENYTKMFSQNGSVPLTYRAVIGKAIKKRASI